MVIELFWSPSNTPTPSDGDQIFFVMNQCYRCVTWCSKAFGHHLIDYHCKMVIKFFRLPRKGVVSYVFVNGFFKTYDTPPFCGDQNVLITIKGVTEMFLIVTTLVIENL